MGKDNLILGTARGKLGDVVFYRTGGEQRFRTRVRPTNPRTNAQLLQRVIISTVAKAYTELITVCDHAFQNFEGKMKNQQRFLKVNAKLMREIALNNVTSWSPIRWAKNNYGNWVSKDSMETVVNPLIVAEGDLQPISFSFDIYKNMPRTAFGNVFTAGDTTLTYQNVCDIIGAEPGDQITFIWQLCKLENYPMIWETKISRVILMPSNGDMSTAFIKTTEGVNSINMPNKENYGNVVIDFSNIDGLNENERRMVALYTDDKESYDVVGAFAVVKSRFENNYWRRSNTQMVVKDSLQNVMSMKNAVASFERDTTSSLYLNQATTESLTSTDMARTEMIQSEIDIDNSQEITKYKKNTSKEIRKNEE